MIRTLSASALLLALATAAHAQSSDRIKLDLSRAELQSIVRGVMELPYKDAAPILNEFQRQLAAQNVPPAPPPPDPDAAPKE